MSAIIRIGKNDGKKELTVGRWNAIIRTPSKMLGIKIVGIKRTKILLRRQKAAGIRSRKGSEALEAVDQGTLWTKGRS